MLILQKTAVCSATVQVVETIAAATQFTLSTNSNVSATVTFNGAIVGTLNSSNTTYKAEAAGDYTLAIIGTCNLASIYADPIVEGANEFPLDSHVSYRCDEGTDTHWRIVSYSTTDPSIVPPITTIVLEEDTNVPCSEPVPIDLEYVTKDLKACNADGEWCVTHVFEVSDLTTVVGTIYFNPTGQLSSDPGDLVECEEVVVDTFSPVLLPDTCANVEGEPQTVTPLVWGNTATMVLQEPVYLDKYGKEIVGEVTPAEDCDCDCTDCPDTPEPTMTGFGVAAFVGSDNTKFNLDDHGSGGSFNAYGDVGLDNWTALDLVNALNASSANATPPTIPTGIDYSSTVFAISSTNPDFIIITSGPVPSILTLSSLPAVIPLITIQVN